MSKAGMHVSKRMDIESKKRGKTTTTYSSWSVITGET